MAAKAKKTGKAKKKAAKSRKASAKKKPGARKKAAPERAPAPGEAGVAELLDMDQAMSLVGVSRPTFYRWLREGKIKGLKLGRQWRFYREDVERFIRGEEPRIELRADIGPLIEQLEAKLSELGVEPAGMHEDDDVVRATALMIWVAYATRASDLHVEPHMSEELGYSVARIRVRVDGVLHKTAEFDMRLASAIVERWKIMANVDVHEKVKPQDGRIMLNIQGEKLDLRVSFMPGAIGEAVTARLLSRDQVLLDLERIDYAPRDREVIERHLADPWGLVVVSGPTGSGKTTVLYACLKRVAGPEIKTVSVEDPVEYFLPWTMQSHLNHGAGVDFPRMMRSALRSDPDVILLGEIRDNETLQMCHQAALTGHLVMTTLHADEAANALVRMVEIGAAPFVVAESTKVVIAQRLVRCLCPECSAVADDPEQLDQATELALSGGLAASALKGPFRVPRGCPKCNGLGYRRRTVIAEVLEVTGAVGKALRRGAGVDEIRSIAVGEGMTTMAADGIRRAAAGQTSLAEVMRVLGLR